MIAPASTAVLHCRGFVLQALVNLWPGSTPWYLLISSVQFAGAHHANPSSTLALTVTGLLLGTSYLQSGRNLLVPIIAHALHNLGVMVYLALL
jgi:membrane protease YdiL (CAAX protease family)